MHVKGRGGGDGRVVFARVYSGTLEARKTLRSVNVETLAGGGGAKPERPAALLELSGGRMEAMEDGVAR